MTKRTAALAAAAKLVGSNGKVGAANIAAVAEDNETMTQMRDAIEELASIWGAIHSTNDPVRRAELIEQHGEALTLASNKLHRDLDKWGLVGNYG